MRMFHLDAMWKNRLPDVRKELRDRYLRAHVESFFAFVEDSFARVQHQRGMLRSALGYCVNQKSALMRFLDDGALEIPTIDRNAHCAELRPGAIMSSPGLCGAVAER